MSVTTSTPTKNKSNRRKIKRPTLSRKGVGVRYPYRAKNPGEKDRIRREISQILSEIEHMLFKIARDILPSETDTDTVQEVVQKCMIWLWEKSLPRYDAWRLPRVKVSTFLYTCAHNFIKQEKRAILRRRKTVELVPDGDIEGVAAPHTAETLLDRRIEGLSKDILANPEKYMTPAQAGVFKALTKNPEMMMKTLAKFLKYRRASSLSMIKRRINQRISEISIENHEPE